MICENLTLEYIRIKLAWIATQFLGLTKINLCWKKTLHVNRNCYRQDLRDAFMGLL